MYFIEPNIPKILLFQHIININLNWKQPWIFTEHAFLEASGSLPMSWLFAPGGQSIRTSASASVLPMNIQDWFSLGLTSLISLLSKGLSRVFSSISLKAPNFWHSAFFKVQLSQLYMTTRKIIALTIWNFVSKTMSLLFKMLSRFITAFFPSEDLPHSKYC